MSKLKKWMRCGLLGCLFLPMIVCSQEAVGALDLEFKMGYFVPSEDALLTVYGGGLTAAGEMSVWSADGWGIRLGAERFRKMGDFPGSEDIAEISITSFNATLLWIDRYFSGAALNRRIYLGLGGGTYTVDEEVEEGFPGGAFRLGVSEDSTLGFHVVSGMSINISENTALTLETKVSLATVEGEGGLGGAKVNLGGYTLFLGLRF